MSHLSLHAFQSLRIECSAVTVASAFAPGMHTLSTAAMIHAQKLRVECKARGVSTSGSKTQMLDRIEDHDTALVVSFAPDGLDADGDNATDPFDYDAGDDGCGENDHADDFSAPDNDDHQVRATCLKSICPLL
jgi:hypothetical protein